MKVFYTAALFVASLTTISAMDLDRNLEPYTCQHKEGIVAVGPKYKAKDLIVIAEGCWRQGHIDKAIELCKKALEARHIYAPMLLGDIFYTEGNKEEAIKYYKMAADQCSSNEDILRILGKVFAEEGNTEESLKYYTMAYNKGVINTDVVEAVKRGQIKNSLSNAGRK